jgi:hypothetical protein
MFEISTRKWMSLEQKCLLLCFQKWSPRVFEIHTLSNHLKGTTSDLQVASLAEKVDEDLVVVEASSVGAEEASHYESTHKE